jgi:hypothetical protein
MIIILEIKKNRRKRRFLLLSVLCATCYRTQAVAARQISPRGGDLSGHFGRGFASFRPADRHPPDAVAHHAHHAARSRVRLALRATSPNPPLPPHARERDRHRDHTATGTATTDGLADTNAATATARERASDGAIRTPLVVSSYCARGERTSETRRRGGGEAAARRRRFCRGAARTSAVASEGAMDRQWWWRGVGGGVAKSHTDCRWPTAGDSSRPAGGTDGQTDGWTAGRTEEGATESAGATASARVRAHARSPPAPGPRQARGWRSARPRSATVRPRRRSPPP